MSYHCMTKMKNRLLVLILIPLLNKMHSLDAYTKACNSSVQTVKRVETCPSSVSSYKKAAKEKNCSSLAGKALECQSFEYHCVLSDDRKYAIEVCAPSINIVGSVCAKFSTNLTGIIRIDDFDCTKCPYSYNSTTAFEYSECYANITLPFTTDSSQNSIVTTTSKENDAVIFDVVSTSNPNDEDIFDGVTTSKPNDEDMNMDPENKQHGVIAALGSIIGIMSICIVIILIWRKIRRRASKCTEVPEIFRLISNGSHRRPLSQNQHSSTKNDQTEEFNLPLISETVTENGLISNGSHATTNRRPLSQNQHSSTKKDQNEESDLQLTSGNGLISNGSYATTNRRPLSQNQHSSTKNDTKYQAKIVCNLISSPGPQRVLLDCCLHFLIRNLKNPNDTWTKDKIVTHVRRMISKLVENNERDRLEFFCQSLYQDESLSNTLLNCGEDFYALIISMEEKYHAQDIILSEGSFCVTFCFEKNWHLENLLKKLESKDEQLIKDLSTLTLNKTLLKIFNISPQQVWWTAWTVKIYKGTQFFEKIFTYPIEGCSEDCSAIEPRVLCRSEIMGDKPGPSNYPLFLLDKSSENYLRLTRLITTVCGPLLRDILSHYIKPVNLRKELDIDRVKLEKYMTIEQKEQFYLTAGSNLISPKDLDISVLYMLLRNICTKLPPPKTGWGKPPQKGDNSESAFIERVRHIRNTILARNTHGKVSDTDFQQYWEELENSIIAMEKQLTGDVVYQDAISKIKNMKFTKDDAEENIREIQQSEDPIENIPQNQLKDKAFDGSRAKKLKSSTNKQLVAAIDFGTAYSGHAFSSRGDFENDPLRITAHKWSQSLLAHKTPTSALFDKNKTLIAFGYEAEKMFRELSESGKHEEHYFFERFKMQLYNKSGDKKKKKLTNKSMILDISGKELPAMYVFSKAIEYMHDHLLKRLKEQNDDNEIAEQEIKWVLTVPAIWEDSAKQFMRDAAEQAGINDDNLTIALEQEAASMYCKKVPLEKLSGPESEFQIFSPGNQYLILDAGGGTVDIAIHEVLTGDRIKELHKATGGAWGGTYLDDEFFKIFEECFGKDEFEKFKKDDLASYIELRKDLEIKKRDISSSTHKISLTIPHDLKCKCDTTRSEFAEYLVCKGEKLEFDGSLIQKWYSKVCNNIEEHVKKLLEEHEIDNILMVGGFSESQFLRETMTKAFPNKCIVVPNEASLAVLKGAVLFGHKPSSIISRVAKFTYGVETSLPIKDEETVLDEKRIAIIDGVRYERDVFSKHVTKGTDLEVDKAQYEMAYLPLLKNQKTIRFRVYTSSLENPKYIDDPECRPLGYINVDIPDGSEGPDRKVRVRFIFGGTEIKVEGVNERTGKKTSVKFNYSDTTEEERYLCKPDD